MKKLFLWFAVAAVLGAVGVLCAIYSASAGPNPIMVPAGSTVDSTGVASADLDMNGYDIKNTDDIYGTAVTTDAAPRDTVIAPQCIYTAPGATNVTGADLVLAPSPGENTLDGVTRAATTGDTLTFAVLLNTGAYSSTVKTEGAASPDGWDCDGAASDIECVCNLYTLLTGAGAITGVTVTRTDATCSDEKLTFTVTPGTSAWLSVTTSDDTNLDMTNGAGGQVQIAAGTAALPGLSFHGDTDTGILLAGANNMQFSAGGSWRIMVDGTEVTIGSTSRLNTRGRVYTDTGALNLGTAATTSHALGTGAAIVGAGGLEVDGDHYADDRVINAIATLADGDATPSVAGGNFFLTPANTNPTVITDLDDPVAGQVVTICIGSATNPSTIADAGNFNLSAAWNPGLDDCLTLLVTADNDYIELSRADN